MNLRYYFCTMKVFLIVLFSGIVFILNAQNDTAKVFSLDLEFRPRIEFRRGYAKLPEAGDKPAFFISNRTRFTINFDQKKFKFHSSIQDIRVWGEVGSGFTGNTFGIFEAYIEPFFNEKWSVRIGRQAVELDNARLFARANWNQASRAHEGVNLRYTGKKVQSELMGFYNQNSEQLFGTDYSFASSNYLFLALHSANYQLSKKFGLYTLNAFDGYQQVNDPNVVFVRGTSGGRISFKSKKINATIAAYFQYGDLVGGIPIQAYYAQPEISFEHKTFKASLGMEYMSGDHLLVNQEQSNSFSTLYGVAFRFMGNMNYFTHFPNDTHNAGLIDPYLFSKYTISDRFSLKLDWHLFFSQQELSTNVERRRFLGVEQDLTVNYKVNDYISMSAAVCVMAPSESMEYLQNRTIGALPIYSYYMLTVNPELFRFSKPIEKEADYFK